MKPTNKNLSRQKKKKPNKNLISESTPSGCTAQSVCSSYGQDSSMADLFSQHEQFDPKPCDASFDF